MEVEKYEGQKLGRRIFLNTDIYYFRVLPGNLKYPPKRLQNPPRCGIISGTSKMWKGCRSGILWEESAC